MKFVMTCTAAAVLSAIAQSAAAQTTQTETHNDTLDMIVITAPDESQPAVTRIATDDLSGTRDTAEALRDIPGVSGSRIGGHGMDPVIRGQSQNRLNVLLDGAYVHGGCPNRMDPPTAYAPSAGYEEITVIKGVRTLEYGAGGAGGTILFNRETEAFYADEPVRVSAEAGYRSNGNIWDASVDTAAGSEQFYARFIGSYMDASSYDDGAGEEVRSGFEESSGSLILGYTPDNDSRLDITIEAQRTDDLLYAGAGMDSPESDNDTLRFKYQADNLPGAFDSFKFEAYSSEVSHVMDNYTLRDPANPMMLMRAPSTSDTLGGRAVLELDSDIGHWKLGLDIQNNERNADRFNDFNGTLNSVLWPGVTIEQTGIFAELEHDLDSENRLIGGIRYDHVRSDASRADVNPPMMAMSPNELYAIYYDGAEAKKRSENNWSGLLRFEHDLSGRDAMVYAGLSRTVRTADATERFIASNSMSADGRWVGNPMIDPEQHHQVEAGITLQGHDWNLDASVYYSDVNDYILRDRYHVVGNNATIYRNVDATLYGFETTLAMRWSSDWSSNFGIAYVHANNDTDDRPIAQTPPLEAIASLTYDAADWRAGARVRAAATQTRVDDDASTGSGLDVGETPGWAVVDLYGNYRLSTNVSIDFGIDNLFDKEYAQHLNRSSAFDPEQIQVNEPGISGWIKLSASF